MAGGGAAAGAAPVLFGIPRVDQAPVNLLHLAGFGMIIWAILRKNLQRGAPGARHSFRRR